MGEDAVYVLDIIKVNSTDNVECCIRMFTEWHRRIPKASWKQLIEALNQINLTRLASELEELLIPSKNPSIEKTRRIPRQSSLEELEGSYIVSCVCSFISQTRLYMHHCTYNSSTVEPVYYGHLGTSQKCPDYQGVLISRSVYMIMYHLGPQLGVWILCRCPHFQVS